MEFSNTKFIGKSRKDHICCFCQSTIPSGTSYYAQANKYEGEFYILKMCPICRKVTGRLDISYYEYIPTYILEDVIIETEQLKKDILDPYLRHPNPSCYLQEKINKWSKQYNNIKAKVRSKYIEV